MEAPDKQGLEYLYSLSNRLQVSPDVINRHFPGSTPIYPGEKHLHSDLTKGEFENCTEPLLHLGRCVGRTRKGLDIIINAELNFTSWESCSRFDPPIDGGSNHDYTKLVARRLEKLYDSLPILVLSSGGM